MTIIFGLFGYFIIPALLTSLLLVKISAVESGHSFRKELATQDIFVPILLGLVWPFGLLMVCILGIRVVSERKL